MKTKMTFSILLVLSITLSFNSIEAQTLKFLEKVLSEEVTPPPPPPRCTFWEDSWDDWYDNAFWGVNYSYSKQFPISLSFQAHRRYFFFGIGLGSANKMYTFDYNSSTPDSSLSATIIINGVTTQQYDYFNRDSSYSVTPKYYAIIEPGFNINFVTLSCAIGLWWGDGEKQITKWYSGTANLHLYDCSYGWLFNPNMMLHLPIPGTGNDVHLTVNAGYNFLLPSLLNGDPVVRRLTSFGNGWRFGLGLEFIID